MTLERRMGDVKGPLVTTSTDLGYWFGAESKEKGRLYD